MTQLVYAQRLILLKITINQLIIQFLKNGSGFQVFRIPIIIFLMEQSIVISEK